MRRLFVFVLSLGILAAVTACAPPPPEPVGCDSPPAQYIWWQNCNKGGADLSGADLRDSNLQFVNFANANLSGANLLGAYMTGANLTNTNLTGAVGTPTSSAVLYDNTTCPDGMVAPAEVPSCW